MQVSVVQSWNIEVDGGPSITLPDSLVKKFEDSSEPWLLMKPTCHKLCKLLSWDMEKDLGKNPTLAGSEGLLQLKKLRNTQNKFAAVQDGIASLFDDSEQQAEGHGGICKKHRYIKKDHSMVPDIIYIDIDGVSVAVRKALHPNEDLCVLMTPEALSSLFTFVRGAGLDLTAKKDGRPYERSGKWTKASLAAKKASRIGED
jgi:hypothetical protein